MIKRAFVTGAAGFIGFHLSKRLISRGVEVVGYDNLNEYYDVSLKNSRLAILKSEHGFSFIKDDLENTELLLKTIVDGKFDCIIHLAAQAGVRYSLENPGAYISSNITGTFNILEAAKAAKTPHLLYASSSSVYGANTEVPFSVEQKTDSPVSLYAATKKSNELMAYSYSYLFGVPTTGLRFFTVYGPYGRPDMALFMFVKNILESKPIEVYNNGDMYRDFTYIDDIVSGICALMTRSASLSTTTSAAVYNIGSHSPVRLSEFIKEVERALGMKAKIEYKPMQPGDVYRTYADVDALERDTGFKPQTQLEDGIAAFVDWYRGYYAPCRSTVKGI